MLTGMAEGPIPGMQVLRWGDTLGWKFSPKKMEVELVHLFCFQGAFGWREGLAWVCSWCHRQRSQGGLTSWFGQFMLGPLVTRRENTILYLSWIRFGKSINLFCSVSSLLWFWQWYILHQLTWLSGRKPGDHPVYLQQPAWPGQDHPWHDRRLHCQGGPHVHQAEQDGRDRHWQPGVGREHQKVMVVMMMNNVHWTLDDIWKSNWLI